MSSIFAHSISSAKTSTGNCSILDCLSVCYIWGTPTSLRVGWFLDQLSKRAFDRPIQSWTQSQMLLHRTCTVTTPSLVTSFRLLITAMVETLREPENLAILENIFTTVLQNTVLECIKKASAGLNEALKNWSKASETAYSILRKVHV